MTIPTKFISNSDGIFQDGRYNSERTHLGVILQKFGSIVQIVPENTRFLMNFPLSSMYVVIAIGHIVFLNKKENCISSFLFQ